MPSTNFHSPTSQDRIMRTKEVIAVTGRSRSSIHRDEKAGAFPKRRKIGQHAIGWLESEINGWMKSRETIE